MRFISNVAVHHYSQKFGMVRHTDFLIVYNEVIVDVNISPPFPGYNEIGLFQIQRQLINVQPIDNFNHFVIHVFK